jgi:hypothetical protein
MVNPRIILRANNGDGFYMFLLLCPFTIFGDGSLLALLHYLSFEISGHFSVDLLFDSVSSRDIWVFVGLESAGTMGFKGKNIGFFKKVIGNQATLPPTLGVRRWISLLSQGWPRLPGEWCSGGSKDAGATSCLGQEPVIFPV